MLTALSAHARSCFNGMAHNAWQKGTKSASDMHRETGRYVQAEILQYGCVQNCSGCNWFHLDLNSIETCAVCSPQAFVCFRGDPHPKVSDAIRATKESPLVSTALLSHTSRHHFVATSCTCEAFRIVSGAQNMTRPKPWFRSIFQTLMRKTHSQDLSAACSCNSKTR